MIRCIGPTTRRAKLLERHRPRDILELNRQTDLLSSARGICIEDQSYAEYLARRTFQETDGAQHLANRLQPASLSGYWCNWGGDNRNVTVRLSAESGKKARLEHRMADAAANPHTATATVLQAALLGYENNYPLQPMETGNGFSSNDAAHGTAASLAEAIDDLESDGSLTTAIGAGLVENHLYMKHAEVEKTALLDPDALRDWYIWYL